MPHIIGSECNYCGACQGVCPRGAIYAGDDSYVIDNDICDDCGQCVEACPVKCIKKVSLEELVELE